MKQPIDLARSYLLLADRDIKALELLVNARQIDDETVGFHAQQAVEKCLKAVLAFSSISFRKTHDLQELMDLLLDNKKTAPPNAEQLDALNPYAVLMRYDFVELKGFNRGTAYDLVMSVRKWAEQQLS
jgi:HEPN domain-containing protein